MIRQYYSDVKWLIEQPQWKTYEKLLEDERNRIFAMFENCNHENYDTLQTLHANLVELKKVMRMPHDLVKESESK